MCLSVLNISAVSGKPAEDDLKLGTLKLKPNTKIMMMGSREESLVILFVYLLFDILNYIGIW